MSPWRGFREPIGPEPARTYWIRRGLVVLIAVLVIALIVWLLSSLAGGSARKGGADPAAASFTPNPSWSDTGWATPINTSASQSASPHASPSSGASTPATPSPTPTPTPSAPPCTATTVNSQLKAKARRFAAGSAVDFTITVTNDSAAACTWDMAALPVELTITSGVDLIWTTAECPAWRPKGTHEIASGKSWSESLSWPGKRAKGCDPIGGTLRPGTYVATGKVKGGGAYQFVFQLS